MIMRTLSIFALAIAFSAVAADLATANSLPVVNDRAASRAAQNARMQTIREKQLKSTGGFVVKQNSRQGRVAFINAQSRMKQKALDDIAAQLSQYSHLDIVSIKGETSDDPAMVAKKYNVTVAITIVDNKDGPLMLLAPEDKWAVLNVGRIVADEKFDQGCCKGLLRTFAHLCESGMSQYPGNVMSVVRLEDAYRLESSLPIDVTMRQLKYLSTMGVKPDCRVSYATACREGWAPAPTNDIQKAIWDQIKSDKERGPAKPLTIPPPTKK